MKLSIASLLLLAVLMVTIQGLLPNGRPLKTLERPAPIALSKQMKH